MTADLEECKIYFKPIQNGTGDASPSNVRAISGWDGIEVGNDSRYGGKITWNQCLDPSTIKILGNTSGVFNVTKINTGFRVIANSNISDSSGSRVVYFTIKWNRIQNHHYLFLCKVNGSLQYSYIYIYCADGSTSRVTSPNSNSDQYFFLESYTGNTSDGNPTLRFYIYKTVLSKDLSFEVTDLMAIDLEKMFGDSVIEELYQNTSTDDERIAWFKNIITNYDFHQYNTGEITSAGAINGEPYATYSPISWANDYGTIYGGYVDLKNGEIVAEYGSFDIYANRNLLQQGNGNPYIRRGQFKNFGYEYPININKAVSSHFKATSATTEDYPSFSISPNGDFAMRGIVNVTDTVEHFKTYLEEQINNNTPVQFILPLATPIHYPITPVSISTLQGVNNIWSTANDNIQLTYWKHSDDAYQYLNGDILSTTNNYLISTTDGFVLGKEVDYIEY